MGTYSTSERTRHALIEAAGALVAEKGVGRVSTRAIAKEAGENLGTIHYHFGSKDDLFKEMLRFACLGHDGPLFSEVIEAYENRLDDLSQQAEAVRAVIRHLMRHMFSPERPAWCSRVLYQMVQHSGPLCDFLREQVIDPQFEVVTELVSRIRPDWTKNHFILWMNMLIGPIVFHADHCNTILYRLGADTFPDDYLRMLEQRLVCSSLHALGLPFNVIDDD